MKIVNFVVFDNKIIFCSSGMETIKFGHQHLNRECTDEGPLVPPQF